VILPVKTLTILLTDGPYISECAEIAHRIASKALKKYKVNIFLYLDALHIPKLHQHPQAVANIGNLFIDLAEHGARIRGCPRCAAARGYQAENNCEYPDPIKISSLYDMQEMIAESDRVISITR
jgi:tRNA 2-thiouridine synthesizing protein D